MWNGLMEEERKNIIRVFNSSADIFINASSKISKDSFLSEQARLVGNKLFQQKIHDSESHKLMLHKYSLSIALAPPSSEAEALGYGNRSAILLHLEKFLESIQDIDRALSITKSNVLKTKLLCRKVKCLAAIGSTADIDKILQKARHFYSNSEKNKKVDLLKLIKEAEIYSHQKKYESSKEKNTKKKKILKVEKDLNDFSSISIAYNDKFGNHLVAAKDIDPGEVVFIEKPYVFAVATNENSTYCSHCFKLSWASVPCNSCWICMYCSEECKKNAWNKYHSIECAVFINCRSVDFIFEELIQITIRAVIAAVKQAGSIENLKNNLKKLDKKQGMHFKKNFKDGKLHNQEFENIYNLYCKVNPAVEQILALHAVNLLISFAKHSTLFGTEILNRSNSCSQLDLIGCSFSILYSLINHSCCPNVNFCHTEDKKIVVYAIQPIKKNTQIFISYFISSFLEDETESNFRRKFLFSEDGFICDCMACQKNLPELLQEQLIINNIEQLKTLMESEKYNNIRQILKIIGTKDKAKFNKKMISILAEAIILMEKQFPQSYYTTSILAQALTKVFEGLYQIKLIIPNQCSNI